MVKLHTSAIHSLGKSMLETRQFAILRRSITPFTHAERHKVSKLGLRVLHHARLVNESDAAFLRRFKGRTLVASSFLLAKHEVELLDEDTPSKTRISTTRANLKRLKRLAKDEL